MSQSLPRQVLIMSTSIKAHPAQWRKRSRRTFLLSNSKTYLVLTSFDCHSWEQIRDERERVSHTALFANKSHLTYRVSVKVYQYSGDFLQRDENVLIHRKVNLSSLFVSLEQASRKRREEAFLSLLRSCSIGVEYWGNDLLLASSPDSRGVLWAPHL